MLEFQSQIHFKKFSRGSKSALIILWILQLGAASGFETVIFKGELKPKFNTFLYCSFKKSNTYKIKFRWLFVSVALLFSDNLV